MNQKKLIVTVLIIVILAAVGITVALLTRPESAPATPAEATLIETVIDGTVEPEAVIGTPADTTAE